VLKFLTKAEKERLQKKGYMGEHLLCLYSMVCEKTALYNDNFPIYFNGYDEVDIILFGLSNKEEDGLMCIDDVIRSSHREINIVTPKPLKDIVGLMTKYVDWDYHINADLFDLDLHGHLYQNIRYSLNRAAKMRFRVEFSRKFTQKHIYVISRHMKQHDLDLWDFEELLSLERFFRDHNHGFMMEVYHEDKLVGFDVIDFFEDNNIMVIPIGVYLDLPSLADFLMYENIKYAKKKGYKWIDIGFTCRNNGLKNFKEKWLARPKYELFVQTISSSK